MCLLPVFLPLSELFQLQREEEPERSASRWFSSIQVTNVDTGSQALGQSSTAF